MNILLAKDFVAGIFADWADAQRYRLRQPATVTDSQHINTNLTYPFYLLEAPAGTFTACQTEAEVRASAGGSGILFEIEADYEPDPPWTDRMGNLPHEHLDDLDAD